MTKWLFLKYTISKNVALEYLKVSFVLTNYPRCFQQEIPKFTPEGLTLLLSAISSLFWYDGLIKGTC